MMLLPAAKDTCPICATKHAPELPHNQPSLYYQYRFYGIRGRWPTWPMPLLTALRRCEINGVR